MPNSYFEFKKFRVDQDRCAMKVCTLSCILGAYSHSPAPRRILDIGTGTGLLALMLAQRYPGIPIDAVEIDGAAYAQACENVEASPWKKDIFLFHGDIEGFNAPNATGYDLVVSNPPFFENHQKSRDSKINRARHDDALNSTKLLKAVSNLLATTGKCFVLLPHYEARRYSQQAPEQGLFANARLNVFNFPGKPCKAAILTFERQKGTLQKAGFCIWRQQGAYSDEFVRLLKGYYLHL